MRRRTAAPQHFNFDFVFDSNFSPIPAFSEMIGYTDSPKITYDALRLNDTKITDAGLETLEGLTALQTVLLTIQRLRTPGWNTSAG